MPRWTIICLAVMLPVVLAGRASAVTWSYEVESLDGSDDFWFSDTAVPTGFPQYDYSWHISEAEVRVEEDGIELGWISILDSIAPENQSGSGSAPGAPFEIFGAEGLNIPEISADFNLGVLADGHGLAALFNVQFGTMPGGDDIVYDITGARIAGDFTVTPVPEPASMLLLGIGSLVLLRKRRK